MFIADFHIHSKHSRATSRDCVPELLDFWACRKGLNVIGSGDFTHRAWREELKEKLAPAEEGLYTLKQEFRQADNVAAATEPRFIISGEISSIYKKNGKVRKVHNLILLPSIEAAEMLSRRLEAIGNLHSDGRPILGLDSRDLLEITLGVSPQAIFIPAHIWTPHFSLFGAYSGFDDIRECFEDLTGHIQALETGLSSDPPMNWRLSALDAYTLVSNSDAHSPAKLAREANIFDTALSYPHIAQALANRSGKEFYGTLEFFPEEGKYHYDGHRDCKVCQKPAHTIASSGVCPVCGGKITVGVLHRVEALADRAEGFAPPSARHFESLVPLTEVIAASTGFSAISIKGQNLYNNLLQNLGPELTILREAPLADIEQQGGPVLAEGIRRLRAGEIEMQPGYDGVYGKVKILDQSDRERLAGQLHFFSEQAGQSPLDGSPKPPRAKRAKSAAPPPDKKTAPSPAGLNKQQQQAVSSASPAIAVIAGPGTGKTKTLVARVAHLVQHCGVPPADIIAVTFTNKAAQEMRTRLEQALNDKRAVKAMTIGTFHSICLRILSTTTGRAGITVIDEANALALLRDILDGMGLKNSPRQVLRAVSLHKNGALPDNGDSSIPDGVYDAYQQQLAAYGVLDYDDILLKALQQAEGGAGRCAHLLVDEFQDINPVQYRLIKAWGSNSDSVFVIGDPQQSIYGFRGADANCFEWLFADFPQVQRVNLTQNYRSTPQIIRCAGAAMPGEKAGLLEAKREGGAKVRLVTAENAVAEALFVAREINNMVGGLDMLGSGQGSSAGQIRGFSDIAVLYRANRQADMLERYLQKKGIPYTVAGRDEFLSEPQVLRALAFFKFLLNPADMVSLRRCLKETAAYPADLLQDIFQTYAAAKKSAAALISLMEQAGPLSGEARLFMESLNKYGPRAKRKKPAELLEGWIIDNGLGGMECLEKLLHVSVLYADMPSLLHNLALGREGDVRRSGGRTYARDAVSLMTLHAAKGLEFPVVFLAGATEGLLPLTGRGGVCNLAEERRLFYVGMTRAQDELLLLSYGTPSPFMADLPPDCLMPQTSIPRRAVIEQFSLFKG